MNIRELYFKELKQAIDEQRLKDIFSWFFRTIYALPFEEIILPLVYDKIYHLFALYDNNSILNEGKNLLFAMQKNDYALQGHPPIQTMTEKEKEVYRMFFPIFYNFDMMNDLYHNPGPNTNSYAAVNVLTSDILRHICNYKSKINLDNERNSQFQLVHRDSKENNELEISIEEWRKVYYHLKDKDIFSYPDIKNWKKVEHDNFLNELGELHLYFVGEDHPRRTCKQPPIVKEIPGWETLFPNYGVDPQPDLLMNGSYDSE